MNGTFALSVISPITVPDIIITVTVPAIAKGSTSLNYINKNTLNNMPKIKAKTNQQETTLLKKVQKLSPELIRLIYEFTNGKIQLIVNPKWNWYMKNINTPIKIIEFNIKLKIIINNFNYIQILNFYKHTLKYNPQIYNFMVQERNINIYNIYHNKYLFYILLVDFISDNIAKYIYYKNRLLSNNRDFFSHNEENNYLKNMQKINNVIILCKSILYIYSKYFKIHSIT
jgi:hypothetical protein